MRNSLLRKALSRKRARLTYMTTYDYRDIVSWISSKLKLKWSIDYPTKKSYEKAPSNFPEDLTQSTRIL